jgi:predicted dehydrogenase
MKMIKVAVIGTGYLGRFHAEKYAKLEGVELIAVVDIDQKRAEEIAGGLTEGPNGPVKAYSSYDEILGMVDAVSIVTPTNTHLAIGKDFLLKGVNVLL